MKNIILNFLFISLAVSSISAQNFQTDYIRGESSTYCAEENFSFNFEKNIFTKIDSYDGSKTVAPSKVAQTNYDNNGYYFEVRSPKYILDDYGIDEYRKYYHYSHKILYDKRGGNVLYVYEVDMDSKVGKFYFTKKGYELFCR